MFLAVANTGELGREAAMALREALLPVAFLLALTGFLWQTVRNGDNWQAHVETIVSITILVLLISNWAGITESLRGIAKSITEIARAKMEDGRQERLLAVLSTAAIKAPKAGFGIDPWALADAFAYQGVQLVQRIGLLAQMFLGWIQQFALNGLLAISPLLLGFLTIPWTRQIATNFLFATLSVTLWDVGFALADVIIFQVQDALLDFLRSSGVLIPKVPDLAAGVAIEALSGRWILFFAGFGAIVIFNVLLYFAAPVLVGLLMRGANPVAGAAGVLRQVIQTGRSAASAATAAQGAARAAEAIGAQVQAANATTQAGAAHAQAMSAFQQAIASGQASQIPSPFSPPGTSGTSAGTTTPPPPAHMEAPAGLEQAVSSGSRSQNSASPVAKPASGSTLASPGDSCQDPGSGASAIQIDAGHFRVIDAQGGMSEHKGNLGDPQERQAAFTMHQARAGSNQSSPIPLEVNHP